ncbi:MAG: SDR family oxidoreductase [Bacteroidia bacterium]|nr:SDR family oxidoreductase [Bacteroidia bacterium]MBP9688331.1 SDR family oxidoreductase [Bacteroidia bacterium]
MENNTVLIIGATGAIGGACKTKFEQAGYSTYTTSSAQEKCDNNTCFWVDFNNIASIEALTTTIKFDCVIISAGKEPQFNLEGTSYEHLLAMINIHLLGPILLLKQIKNNVKVGGAIILLSSPAALKGSYDPIYASAKGAVNALIKTLAKDLAPAIRINAISPSLIADSPVFNRMTPDFREKHLNNTLTHKHTTAQECAEAIYFMSTQKQITGQVLQVNGGMI